MSLSAGLRLGAYEILSPLGAGGMGEVFRARDTRLDRDVAIKVLPDSLADDVEALHRFRHEAKVVAALSHPNILSIFDLGNEAGISYAVTELLEGETLRARLRSGPLPPAEALEYAEQLARGLALAPANLALIEWKAMTYLAEGDLAKARSVSGAPPAGVEPTALVAFFATYQDLVWVLTSEQQDLLLRLTPASFDGNRGAWGIHLAQASALRRDAAKTRLYAEEARKAYEEQLRGAPGNAQQHTLLGVALAYLGRRTEAIREGERGVALLPVSKDAYAGAYMQHQLARIHILVGENEKALDVLEPLLKIPYVLSPGWLRIDPTFDPLRGNRRFERLVEGGRPGA